jgi:hypothetical protein
MAPVRSARTGMPDERRTSYGRTPVTVTSTDRLLTAARFATGNGEQAYDYLPLPLPLPGPAGRAAPPGSGPTSRPPRT